MSRFQANTPENRYSLGRNLQAWFLILALAPLTLIAWFGYQQATTGVMDTAVRELKKDAHESARFINNWFDYRFFDLNNQAKNQRNAEFLQALQDSFQNANQPLSEFVKSQEWNALVNKHQKDLINFSQHYDYVNGLYLINNQGNILFSIGHGENLGINLFNNKNKHTKFSLTAKQSLQTGKALFSDIERSAYSGNKLTSFVTAPVLDHLGNKIGIFALQLNLARINQMMLEHESETFLTHYLVGTDGLLRTPIKNTDAHHRDVLKKRIDTDQTQLWEAEHGSMGTQPDNETEIVFSYMGPTGVEVIGIHQTISLPGTKWILISEIEKSKALLPAYQLGQITLIVFILTAVIATILAIVQSKRITRPITQLIEASLAVARGDTNQHVNVSSTNEIGVLASAFNHMLEIREQHEQALIESNLATEKALSDLEIQKFALDQHAIVAITDIRGTITLVNDKFTEISGYSREELIGQNHRLLNSGHHDKCFFRDLYQTISSGKVWNGEICNRSKDNRIYWVDTTIVPILNKAGKPESYIAIRTDITARKQGEFELLHAKEAAETATLQKSEFLANMSHEIRTPMNGIIGMTGLLLDTQLTPKQHSFAKATMSSADALLVIINDILDFSKIEAGKLELEEVPFNLQSIAEDVTELMALKCREKNVELLLRFKPGTERHVLGDPGRVRQILLNLLSNAIKFTEKGHILLTIESTETPNKNISYKVSVEDTGTGIAKNKLNSIFNKFDQEDASTTRKFGGTGLGLAICQQLCNMMNGDIDVQSEKGKGSTFSFTIQLKANPEAGRTYEGLDDYKQLQGLKALVVDDNEIARLVITEQLSTLHIESTTVDSGPSALDALRNANQSEKNYDIVITDFCMPVMNGEMFAKEMYRENLFNGVLILITSAPNKDDGAHFKSLGFDAYLTKPCHPSELPQVLTLTWAAKRKGTDIPLVTRHTIQTVKTGARKKRIFANTQILLVEDNPINITVATELLEGYQCTVTPAGNGLEAVKLVKERTFDLVFMDCQMPEMDGFEATQEIRQYQTTRNLDRVPIVAFTANAMKSDQEKCLNSGMDDYISKPVNQESLEKVLTKWLAQKMIETEEDIISPTKELQTPATLPHANHDNILDIDSFGKLKKLFNSKFPMVIEQHTQNAAANVELAQQAFEQSDLETLSRAAHSIKGASAQFGAIQLNQLAAEMELLAKNGHLEQAGSLIPDLRAAQENIAVVMLENAGD